jgi:hypothetical protein
MKYTKLIIFGISTLVFMGCNEVPQLPQPHVPQNKSNFVQNTDNNLTKPMDINQTKVVKKPVKIPKPPKKNIKLKEVQDNNFSPDYMYPETQKPKIKKVAKQTTPKASTMTQAECINLIGQDRFDRYTQMLGGTSGAIKRCMMIKASQG